MNLRLLVLPLLLAIGSGTLARVTNRVLDSRESLVLQQHQDVTQLRSYLVQHDNWSCGLRCVFHVMAFEKALQNPNNFEATLKHHLQDAALLNTLDSKYCNNHGLSNRTIMHMAKELGFGNRLLCLAMNDRNNILYMDTVRIPWGASKADIEHARNQKLKETLNDFTSRVKRAPQAVYFIAGTEGHWILYALVNLPNKPAQLYLIDSCNVGLRVQRKLYVDFFKPYVQEVNNGKHIQPAPAKPVITPAIAAHIVKKVKPAQQAQQKKQQKRVPNKKRPAKKHIRRPKTTRKPKRHVHRRPIAKPAPRPAQRVQVRVHPAAAKALWLALNKQKPAQVQRNSLTPFAYAIFQKYSNR